MEKFATYKLSAAFNVAAKETEVLNAVAKKVTVFHDITPYISVDGYRRFGRTCCFHLQINANYKITNSVRGGVVVKALRYKPAGRGFDSRWCHWNFSLT
jgi:hypothetical protein